MGHVAEFEHVEGFVGGGEEDGRGVTGAGVVGGRVCGCYGAVGGIEFLVVWENGKGAEEEVRGWGGGKGYGWEGER